MIKTASKKLALSYPVECTFNEYLVNLGAHSSRSRQVLYSTRTTEEASCQPSRTSHKGQPHYGNGEFNVAQCVRIVKPERTIEQSNCSFLPSHS